MNEEMISQLITKISEKVGAGAEFSWAAIMKQQYVIAVMGIAYFILGIILAIALYKFEKYAIKKAREDKYSMWDIAAIMVGLLVGIACLVLIFGGANDAITHFINPQFYAIQTIIGVVK